MEKLNVLILSAGRRVELVKSFKEAMEKENVTGKVIALDTQKNAPALYFADHQANICPVNSLEYCDELISICNTFDIDLVIPTIDPELIVLSKNKERIERQTNARIMISDEMVIQATRNKFKTYAFLKQHGFSTPKVITDKDIDNEDYVFPLFIKPMDGSSSLSNFKVSNREELHFFRNYVKNPIIQEFIDGEEYCVDIFTDFEGNPITIVPKLRISSREGEILKGKVEKHRQIISSMKELVSVLKPIGEINVDCILSNGEVFIIEINARFAGGCPMSFKAGADSPRNLIKLLKGETLSYREDYQDGLIGLRFDDCIYI